MRLTLFDLDGTLLQGDSDHAWGELMIALGWTDGDAYRRANDAHYLAYQNGTLDIAAYVDFCTAPWRDRPAADLDAARDRFVDGWVRPALHARALALVQRHRDAGDMLAVVTATNDVVTRPIADLFGVQTLIATELDRDADGRVTGAIRGTPAFRDGKIVRVRQWLAGQGMTLDGCERSTFYSDSGNDLPLLELVTHPVATNPAPPLRALAARRGWPILDLFPA